MSKTRIEKKKSYRIYMEAVEGLDEGYYCGHSARYNGPFYRTDDKRDADVFDDEVALAICIDNRKYGYPCNTIPKIPDKRRLALLEYL